MTTLVHTERFYENCVLRMRSGARVLMPGEREEFRVVYGDGSVERYEGVGVDRGMSDDFVSNGRMMALCGGWGPLYRIRVIWKAPKPKRDLWVRPGSDAPWSGGYAIMDGSEIVETGFEYRSAAEDRMRELMGP